MADSERDVLAEALSEYEDGDARHPSARLMERLRGDADRLMGLLAARGWRLVPSAPDVRALVNEQAEDEGLWFIAQTAAEGYLQQELRRLHRAIEAAQPSAEPGLDVAVLARAMRPHVRGYNPFPNKEPQEVRGEYELWHASEIAKAYAALAPDRPTPGEATARCGNCQHDADIHSPVNAELCAVPGCSCPGYLTVSR